MPESSLASMSISFLGNGFECPLELLLADRPAELLLEEGAAAEVDLGVFAGVRAGTPVLLPPREVEEEEATASENDAERRPAPVRVVRRVRRLCSSVPLPRLAAREGGGESSWGEPPSSSSGQLTVEPRLPDTPPGVDAWKRKVLPPPDGWRTSCTTMPSPSSSPSFSSSLPSWIVGWSSIPLLSSSMSSRPSWLMPLPELAPDSAAPMPPPPAVAPVVSGEALAAA